MANTFISISHLMYFLPEYCFNIMGFILTVAICLVARFFYLNKFLVFGSELFRSWNVAKIPMAAPSSVSSQFKATTAT
jgi:hypothetical protein